MTFRQLVFERDLDLPRAIVWHALVDPVLVGGWLGEADIDPVLGGHYRLEWLGATAFAPTDGAIRFLSQPDRLTVMTDVHGEFDIVLAELEGGSRATSTRLALTVTLEIDDVFEARVRANWVRSLDQLAALLRGHPVDWREVSPREATGRSARGTDRA